MIPTNYTVNGINIKTVVKEVSESKTCYGSTDFVTGIVTLYKNVSGSKISESQMHNTAFHEMIHVILDSLGEYELSADEKFICKFAGALCQVFRSAVTSSYDELIKR